MADPTPANASPTPAAQHEKDRRTSAADTAVNLESKSFDPADRRIADTAAAQRDGARQAAETTREAGVASRENAREGVDLWRASMEPFTALQMDMNRWFEDLWRHATGMSAYPALRTPRAYGAGGAAAILGLPATDVKETDAAYLLAVELPGLRREDVELSCRNDLLTLSGHKSETSEDKGAAYRISERRFGRFERSFPIPPDVARDAIKADFRDGVLTVTLPKHEASGRRAAKIEIAG